MADQRLEMLDKAIAQAKALRKDLRGVIRSVALDHLDDAISALEAIRKDFHHWEPRAGEIIEVHAALAAGAKPWELTTAGRYRVCDVKHQIRAAQGHRHLIEIEKLEGGL